MGGSNGKIKKQQLPDSSGRIHKAKELPDDLIRFSFRHLSSTEKFGHEKVTDAATYLPQFLGRLQSVSDMSLSSFRTNKDKALRAHRHDWASTSEPTGFSHLTPQLQACEAWQFEISVNEHGRVHGILIDEVFYVVWLDPGHQLYPKK